MQEIRLPQLGKAMAQATIGCLKIGLNHTVGRGQVLCELETDKALLELESSAAGMVKHIFCAEGQTLPIHTPLFVIAAANETVSPEFLEKLQKEFVLCCQSVQSDAPVETAYAGMAVQADGDEPWLSKIRPATGPVHTVRESPRPAPQICNGSFLNGKKVPLTRRQRIVADKMLASKQRIPCFYLHIRVDVTDLDELLSRLNKASKEKYSHNDFIMLALARGMKQYPIMTGQLGKDCIVLSPTIGIGLVIAAENGAVAPVVRDVGSKTLKQISASCRDLRERTQANQLTVDDLVGGCITVSNLGGIGIDSFIPIVIPGQCSILGAGRIFESPVPSGRGDILIRKMMNLNLSVDHRVANGADAAQFLDFVKKQLERPAELAGQAG